MHIYPNDRSSHNREAHSLTLFRKFICRSAWVYHRQSRYILCCRNTQLLSTRNRVGKVPRDMVVHTDGHHNSKSLDMAFHRRTWSAYWRGKALFDSVCRSGNQQARWCCKADKPQDDIRYHKHRGCNLYSFSFRSIHRMNVAKSKDRTLAPRTSGSNSSMQAFYSLRKRSCN